MSDWHYSKYESSKERKNMLKGFISLLIIALIISCVIALLVAFAAIYRTHPEYFEPQETLLNTFKYPTPTYFI